MDKKNEKNNNLADIQWFPGHMAKAKRIISENLPLVDMAVELLDARIIKSSSSPLLQDLLGKKPKIIVLNKADLANNSITSLWIKHYQLNNIVAVAVDAINGKGIKNFIRLVADKTSFLNKKSTMKGRKIRKPRLMILGIPNVGKSSLINRLAGNVRVKTENRPGVTRAKQWVNVEHQFDLLDMPGILMPKISTQEIGMKLALTGAINDEVYDRESVTTYLLDFLNSRYQENLFARYNIKDISPFATTSEIFQIIGKKRGSLLKGGKIDSENLCRLIISDFRAGKFGKISLDFPPSI